MTLDGALAGLPLVAILRGLTPDRALAVGQALYDGGFRCLEVPLNSPEPLESIARLRAEFGDEMLVGAGTVLSAAAVEAVAQAGGQLIVSPGAETSVIAAARRLGLWSLPGVFTPTEAFAALEAGANGLKLFPAEAAPPPVVKALKAVLPKDCRVFPVGGITPEGMAAYRAAGADGFGLGSALFTPAMAPAEVGERARRFARAWAELSR